MKIPKSTLYDIFKSCESDCDAERKPGSGRKAEKMPSKNVKKLLNQSDGKRTSQRKLAAKFGITQPYVSKILKNHQVRFRKSLEVPKTTPAQEKTQKIRLRRLAKGVFSSSNDIQVIEDDESYFPLDRSHSVGFYTSDIENVPDAIKFHGRSKYEPKICVWIAISPKGHSQPYFLPSRGAINADNYSNFCLKQRLIPFINENHSDGNYIFWPDGASSHYAKKTLTVLREAGINFVEKEENLPNIPQLRAIERFWSILKSRVYENGWSAANFDQLKMKIRKELKKFDRSFFERLLDRTAYKVRYASRHGPLSVLNI